MTQTISSGILVQRLNQIAPLVGNTPLVQIRGLHRNPNVKIFAKLEHQQIGGSIKTRSVYHILKTGIETDVINSGTTVVDGVGYNAALSFASISAAGGIKTRLFIPETIDHSRLNHLHALGSEVILTPAKEGLEGARRAALKLAETNPGKYYFADHGRNDANWLAHYETTAEEIVRQSFGTVTHVVIGVGSGGTFTGTVRRLREYNKKLLAIALQPETALHGITGWEPIDGLGSSAVFDKKLANDIQKISTREALDLVVPATRKTGLLISPSSAANLAGAIRVSESIDHGVIVTVLPDQSFGSHAVIGTSVN